MNIRRWTALAALSLGALLSLDSLEHGRIGVAPTLAAGGCGVGFHRGPYGACRPNYYGGYYGGPGYYRGGAVYGGRAVYGRRVYGGRVYGGRVYRGGGFHGGRGAGFHGGRGFHGGGGFRR